MTYSPIDAPAGATDQALGGSPSTRMFLSSIRQHFRAMLRASQYGQMVRVLRQMPDSTLTEIGISRSEIPDYARSLFEDK